MAEDDIFPSTEEGWDALRAYFDEIGQISLENVVKDGKVSAEVAGQRITQFNDILIEQLRREADELRSRQAD